MHGCCVKSSRSRCSSRCSRSGCGCACRSPTACWHVPCRLGLLAMGLTVPLLAACAMLALDFDWGPALLLSRRSSRRPTRCSRTTCRVHDPGDRDLVRFFALSGESGLNDGIALPFALAEPRCAARPARRTAAAAVGRVRAHRAVGHRRCGGDRRPRLDHDEDDRLAAHAPRAGALGLEASSLALIVLSFGAAQYAHAFGFIATFAAGVAMRRVEHRASMRSRAARRDQPDRFGRRRRHQHPDKAHAFMAESVLGFTIELERIAEAIVMTMIGSDAQRHCPARC